MNTEELKKIVHERVEKDPSIMTAWLAAELGVKEVEIIRNLPEEMRVQGSIDDFEEIWDAMTDWEKITFLNVSGGCILEVPGKLPKGKFGHGYFNMHHDASTPIGGHIMPDQLESVWFVSKPFFKLESHCVLFFTKTGNLGFGVYLGRDEKKNLIDSVKQGFLRLRQKYENK